MKMEYEDQKRLIQIARDRRYVRGWAGGDDHPFQGPDGYSGYTVTDARNHMTRIKQQIEEKYGITHTPSPATIKRQQEEWIRNRDKRANIDKKVKEAFPLLKKAYHVIAVNEWRGRKAMRRIVRRMGFENISAACAYRAQANKLKDRLLRRAGLRRY
jgi:hypothetical protein